MTSLILLSFPATAFGKEGQTEDEMKAQFSNMTVAQFNAMRNCFDNMSDNSPM
jgi:hypothetical protein